MTLSWEPNLNNVYGPMQVQIATALARAIQNGELKAGQQLPTHRALARHLNVTVTVVTKAYREAEDNGLVVSRTGSGTFVKSFPETLDRKSSAPQFIDLSLNLSMSNVLDEGLKKIVGILSRRETLSNLLDYEPHPGVGRYRAAGARWLSLRGVSVNPDDIVLTNGAHEGLLASVSTIVRPGETILTEKLNYAGIHHLRDLLHFNIRGVEIDGEGMIPEALQASYDTACTQNEKVVAILANPTNHNPTNALAPLKRREAIVSFAKRAGLYILEDDTFGHLSGSSDPTLFTLAPERCIYIAGFSKIIGASTRYGYLIAPQQLRRPVMAELRKMHGSSPVLIGEIVTQLIEQGFAEKILAEQREKALQRQSLAAEILGLDKNNLPLSFHLWVPLPDKWRVNDFIAMLHQRGVSVSPADKFAVDSQPAPNAIRLSLCAEEDLEKLTTALNIVASGLAGRSNHFLPPVEGI